MDLALSEDQRLLVDSAERLLAAAASSSRTRAAAASSDGLDRALWQQVADMGWCGVHLPENLGGLGLGLVETVLLQEQLGRRLACVPYFDAVVCAATLLRELHRTNGDDDAPATAVKLHAAALTTGTCIGTLAEDDGKALATRSTAGWTLTGDWPAVGSAQQAQLLLLCASGVDGLLHLFAVPREHAGLTVVPLVSIDTTRRHGRVQAHDVNLAPESLLACGPRLQGALQRTRQLAAIGLAAEQLGIAQQCLDLTVAYVRERVQFGGPVARFQAVKHRCAQMMVAVESARSAVYGAAASSDVTPPASELQLLAAGAVVEATEAAQFCAQEAIQLHGGVGFTWDYDPQLYFKRAQANSLRFGAVSTWCERVAADLLAEVQP